MGLRSLSIETIDIPSTSGWFLRGSFSSSLPPRLQRDAEVPTAAAASGSLPL